jgi:NAD(P)H-hydrate repair Nnr-like enzyme with NAD(P)H-hydrate epimerase domain
LEIQCFRFSLLVFCGPGANAGDAFRHPFRYAP